MAAAIGAGTATSSSGHAHSPRMATPQTPSPPVSDDRPASSPSPSSSSPSTSVSRTTDDDAGAPKAAQTQTQPQPTLDGKDIDEASRVAIMALLAQDTRRPQRTAARRAVSGRPSRDDAGDDDDDDDSKLTSVAPPAKRARRAVSTTSRSTRSGVRPSDDTHCQAGPSVSKSRRRAPVQTAPQDDDAADAGDDAFTPSGRPQRRAAAKNRQSFSHIADTVDARAPPRTKRPAKSKAAAATDFQFVLDNTTYEYQYGRCHRPRYSKWPQCSSCVAKLTGDTCRFLGIRVFPCDPTSATTPPRPFEFDAPDAQSHAPFLASEPYADVHFDYPAPSALFPAPNDASIASIKAVAAQALLPTMQAELDHASLPTTLWRKPELDIRPQCDFCLTSLFSSSYICRCCGREYCTPCAAQIADVADEDGRNSRFVCRFARRHTADDLVPLTRLRLDEVRDEVREMRQVVAAEHGVTATSSSLPPQPFTPPSHVATFKDLTGPQVDRTVGSHVLTEFPYDVSQDAFRTAWAKGDPIVIHDCIPELRASPHVTTRGWGPWSFTSGTYTTEQCYITRCDQDATTAVVTVADFFATFGKPAHEKQRLLGNGIWKLKDWPPSSAFDDTFPDLYRHFNAALPMPDYTRRDGRMNISAHFPKNANVPDLGPKMYNAWPSMEDQRAKGSTRLHMDIADAVNIMYYAGADDGEDTDDDEFVTRRRGTAAWDIFPASDSQKIRHYLRHTRPNIPTWEDPIHSQSHFLDSNDRRSLFESYDVRSWRIYQRPGDAVFIPAGCAHQVCNLTDCMKIAVDFVSPENVARCFTLTEEFRAMSNTVIKSWKEDVLQLKSMLWHAWRACRVMQGRVYGGKQERTAGVAPSGSEETAGVAPPDRMDRPVDLDTINGPAKGKGKKRAAVGTSSNRGVRAGKAKPSNKRTSSSSARGSKASAAPPVIGAHEVISIGSDSGEDTDEDERLEPVPAARGRRARKRRPIPPTDSDEEQPVVDDHDEDDDEVVEVRGPQSNTTDGQDSAEHGEDDNANADADADLWGSALGSDDDDGCATPAARQEQEQNCRASAEAQPTNELITTTQWDANDSPSRDKFDDDDDGNESSTCVTTPQILSYEQLRTMTNRNEQEVYLSALRRERERGEDGTRTGTLTPTAYEVCVRQAFDDVNRALDGAPREQQQHHEYSQLEHDVPAATVFS